MNLTSHPPRSFWAIAVAAFLLMVVVNYFPVLTGKIPFPSDLVLRHAAWSETGKPHRLSGSPEIGDLITSFYPFHTLAARAARLANGPAIRISRTTSAPAVLAANSGRLASR